jgi:hypothetical protein
MTSPTALFPTIRAAALLPALPLALALLSGDAGAQSRNVFVNGQRMSDEQVNALAQRACIPFPTAPIG